jgi:hypothetical protein
MNEKGRRALKKIIIEALSRDDLSEIFQVISRYPEQVVLSSLFSAICHQDELVRFHAVRCFGRVVSAMAEKELETARIVMRRFLWSLNDESGGIGWGAPEAMAEIMCHSDRLREEYLHMLISYMREDGEELFQDGNFIELPMLQRGVLWGIGRLAEYQRSELIDRGVPGDLAAYLDSADLQVAGLAIWCLGKLGTPADTAKISSFLGNQAEVAVYVDDGLRQVTIDRLAAEAMTQIARREKKIH